MTTEIITETRRVDTTVPRIVQIVEDAATRGGEAIHARAERAVKRAMWGMDDDTSDTRSTDQKSIAEFASAMREARKTGAQGRQFVTDAVQAAYAHLETVTERVSGIERTEPTFIKPVSLGGVIRRMHDMTNIPGDLSAFAGSIAREYAQQAGRFVQPRPTQ